MKNKLWGGRFEKEIDDSFFKFQQSINYDYRLIKYDLLHSIIHIKALKISKILQLNEYTKLAKVLIKLYEKVDNLEKQNKLSDILSEDGIKELEDIHSYIQEKVENKVDNGIAHKLHTLRSRNDQIVFDEKLYCLDKKIEIGDLLVKLNKTIKVLANKYKEQYFIGYTHTQRAQKIKFYTYILSFRRMFERDLNRLNQYYDNMRVYIGAGALTGSSINKKAYNEAIKSVLNMHPGLTKIKPLVNSVDNVSDRDFIIELLSILAMIQMHLSRLAEDLILFSTKEYNLIALPEEYCTGSSLMPHKKNPDFLELVRGNTGKLYSNLMSVMIMMKGLPLAYNRDMQLDKEPLFSSVETIIDELSIMNKFTKGIELKINNINNELSDFRLYVTKFADNLVRDKNIPFKNAHEIAGKLMLNWEKQENKNADSKLFEAFLNENWNKDNLVTNDDLTKAFKSYIDKNIILSKHKKEVK